MGRKIPFENVVRNLRLGRYKGKICSADYANAGIQLFEERKFADNLGVSYYWLQKIGLIRIEDNCGWKVPREPTVKELLNFEGKIKEERERIIANWQEQT